MRTGIILFLVGLLIAFLPLGIGLLAESFEFFDCRTDEGGPHPCYVLGIDIGGLLYFMFVSAFYLIITLPVGGVVSGIGLVTLIISLIKRIFQRRNVAR